MPASRVEPAFGTAGADKYGRDARVAHGVFLRMPDGMKLGRRLDHGNEADAFASRGRRQRFAGVAMKVPQNRRATIESP